MGLTQQNGGKAYSSAMQWGLKVKASGVEHRAETLLDPKHDALCIMMIVTIMMLMIIIMTIEMQITAVYIIFHFER